MSRSAPTASGGQPAFGERPKLKRERPPESDDRSPCRLPVLGPGRRDSICYVGSERSHDRARGADGAGSLRASSRDCRSRRGGFRDTTRSLRLDQDVLAAIAGLPAIEFTDEPHAPEHALEVELPFLQVVLPRFTAVPLLVGDTTPHSVAAVLSQVWAVRKPCS